MYLEWTELTPLSPTNLNNLEARIAQADANVAAGKAEIADACRDMGRSAALDTETHAQLAAHVRNISKDATATAADVLNGKTIYRDGVKDTGIMPEHGNVGPIDLSVPGQEYTIPNGHHGGGGKVRNATIDRAGDTAALSSAVSGNTLRLRASEGYRDGTNDFVTITDNNWTADKIPTGVSMFGKAGSRLACVFSPGDGVIYERGNSGTTESTAPVKSNDVRIKFNGVYRVKFTAHSGTSGIASYAQIYKNGVPYGTLRTFTSSSYVAYAEDLSFAANDNIQLYHWMAAGGGNNNTVEAFSICAAEFPVYTVITP